MRETAQCLELGEDVQSSRGLRKHELVETWQELAQLYPSNLGLMVGYAAAKPAATASEVRDDRTGSLERR